MDAKANRITYTEAQIGQYYERIALPVSRRLLSVAELDADRQLDYLTLLSKVQLTQVPFESLVLHYSWHRVINTDALHVFNKIIQQPGRGGYCMEVNVLFHTVLLSLGFKCYTVPGRVRVGDSWTSLNHLVNIVIIGDTRYYCDVAFGKNLPLQPVVLEHERIVPQIRPAQSRLVYETLDEYLSGSKVWKTQFRANEEVEWETLYCFTELEVMPKDIEAMNYSPWIGRTSFFVKNVICVRHTVGERAEYEHAISGDVEGHEIDGVLVMFNDRVTWTRNGTKSMEHSFKSEDERVEALRKYWGIELDLTDRNAIVGTIAAI